MKKKLFPTILALVCAICCMFSLVACNDGDNPQEVAVTGVTLNKTELTLKIGGEGTLAATVTPDNATNKAVTWVSDNPNVADIENGKVTAKTVGTAVITAKAGDKSATCTVTVTEAAPVKMTKNQWLGALELTRTRTNFTVTMDDEVVYMFDDVSGVILKEDIYLTVLDGTLWLFESDGTGRPYDYYDKLQDCDSKDKLFYEVINNCVFRENIPIYDFMSAYATCTYSKDTDTYTIKANGLDWEVKFDHGMLSTMRFELEGNEHTYSIDHYETTTVTLPTITE